LRRPVRPPERAWLLLSQAKKAVLCVNISQGFTDCPTTRLPTVYFDWQQGLKSLHEYEAIRLLSTNLLIVLTVASLFPPLQGLPCEIIARAVCAASTSTNKFLEIASLVATGSWILRTHALPRVHFVLLIAVDAAGLLDVIAWPRIGQSSLTVLTVCGQAAILRTLK